MTLHTMIAPCLAQSCLALRPFCSSYRRTNRPAVHAMASRNKQRKASPPPTSPTEPEPIEPLPEEPRDFFEGEGWEIVGKVLSYAVPIALVSGLLIGAFAAGTYNEGATVFLDTPKSQDDTAKFFSVVD